MCVLSLIGLLFVIGSIIDEAQGHHDQSNYIIERKCSRARSMLVLKWTVVGFLLTISYKSVLRSMMMKVEYENTIDSVDDLLESDRKLFLTKGPSINDVTLGRGRGGLPKRDKQY